MTIQPPALVFRASSIATIAVVLVAATVMITGRAEAAQGPITPVLTQGAGMGATPSSQVRRVQRALQRRGYDVGAPGADGRFGPLTTAAVRRLQAARGLPADGIVGPRTQTALRLPRRTGSTPDGRSHARRATAASPGPGSTATKPSGASDATRPTTTTTKDQEPAGDVVGTIALWGLLLAVFAAAALVAFRYVVRPRSSRSAGTAPVPTIQSAADLPESANGNGLPSPDWRRDGVLGYVTVSTDAWTEADERSAAAIEATCESSAWDLVEIVCDRENGKTLDRPGLGYALDCIAEGRAGGLVISDMQRLSRSNDDLDALVAWFRDADAVLVALDLGLDTSTPSGHRAPSALITLQVEEADSSPRHTQNGRAQTAVRSPRAVKDHPELVERIRTMRAAQMTLHQIADQLNAEHVPTLRGGAKWRPSSIQAALGYQRPGARDGRPPPHDQGGNGG